MTRRILRPAGGGEGVDCEVADTMWTRMRGLLGRDGLEPGTGLWISPCNSIHMFGMRFPIDALFLARDLHAVRACRGLERGRVVWPVKGAWSVLELPAGDLDRLGWREGDAFAWDA